MAKRRKEIAMLVRVTVPSWMTAMQTRKEVRTLINKQCNYSADEHDVKVAQIAPVCRKAMEA